MRTECNRTKFPFEAHRSRHVVAKAEHLAKGENPGFVLTPLEEGTWPPRELYEQLCRARDELENRSKE